MNEQVRKSAYRVPEGITKDVLAVTTDETMATGCCDDDEHCDVNGFREFHLEELSEFDGSKPEKPILLALLGEIYDVTLLCELYFL
jgi:hypothetical protein